MRIITLLSLNGCVATAVIGDKDTSTTNDPDTIETDTDTDADTDADTDPLDTGPVDTDTTGDTDTPTDTGAPCDPYESVVVGCYDFLDNDCDGPWDFEDSLDCGNTTGFVPTGPSLVVDGGFEAGIGGFVDLPTGLVGDNATSPTQSCDPADAFYNCRLEITNPTVSTNWYTDVIGVEVTGLTIGATYFVSFADRVNGVSNNRLVVAVCEPDVIDGTAGVTSCEYSATVYTSTAGAWLGRTFTFEATQTEMWLAFAFGELQAGDTQLLDQLSVRATP